jgi:hypothetical protein
MAEQLDSQAAVVSPVNVQEFSKKVKEKYPEYKDVDDLTLAKKIVEIYPEYKNQVQFDQPDINYGPFDPETVRTDQQTKQNFEEWQHEQQGTSVTESLHSSLPYVNVDKKQVIPSIQEPNKDITFDQSASPEVGSETRVQNVIPQQQAEEVKYFDPAIQNVGGAQIVQESKNEPTEGQSQWMNENPKLNAVLSMPGMGLIREAFIGSKKAIGGIGTTLDLLASNISNNITGGMQVDETGSIIAPWDEYYKPEKSEFYRNVRRFEDETPISSGGATAFLGQLLPQTAALAATVLLRNPAASKAYLGSMYATSFGSGVESYDDYIASTGQTSNENDRYLVGMGYGAAEYIGEKIGLDYFLPKGYGKLVAKSLDASPSMAQEIGKSVLENYAQLTKQPVSAILKKLAISSQVEGGQELATELLNIATDKWITGKDVSGEEIRDRLLQSYGGGALMGAGIAPFAQISQASANKQRRAEQGTVTISIDEQGLPLELIQTNDETIGLRPDGEEIRNISQATKDKAVSYKTEQFETAIKEFNKTNTITTATIEGQQFTVNNPEDLGIEGKPIFVKDAEGNMKAVANHKATNPITQTVGEIEQANQQQADLQALMNGIADPNAQVLEEINEDNIRLVKFSNGQSKIITPEGEVIANDQAEEDRILEAVINGQPIPLPTVTEQGQVIEPTPERKVITQKINGSNIDIIEGEEFDEVVPSDKMPLDKALSLLEKKFKDNPRFELKTEKIQIEEPGETKYDDPVKKTIVKSIKIVPKKVVEKKDMSIAPAMEINDFAQWASQNHKNPVIRESATISIQDGQVSPQLENEYKIYQANYRMNDDYLKRNSSNNVDTSLNNVDTSINQADENNQTINGQGTIYNSPAILDERGNNDNGNNIQGTELLPGVSELNNSADQPVAESLTADPVAESGNLINETTNSEVPVNNSVLATENNQAVIDTQELDTNIAAQSHNNTPSAKQKETAIYDKARVNLQGYNITLETLKGQERSGVDSNGKAWSITMNNHYGELDGTTGYDGDPIDVFIGTNPKEGEIFVIDQVSNDGSFDESKVMLGFDTPEQAKEAYMSNYQAGWQGFSNITPVTADQFKKWLYDGAKQRKPFAEYRGTPDPVKELTPKKPKQLSKVQQEALQIEVSPTDVRGMVLNYFIAGGSINRGVLENLYGNKKDSTKIEAERRARFTWVSNEGKSIEQIAHSLWEQTAHIETNGLETSDYRNEIEDVINSYTSPFQMAKDQIERYNTDKPQYTNEQLEEMEMLGIFDTPLSDEDIEFESKGSDDAREYLFELFDYYDLTADQFNELNNLFIDENQETNTGTEETNDLSSKEPESSSRVKGKKQGKGKELTPTEKEIEALKSERTELTKKLTSIITQVNGRNGLFGDTSAKSDDLFQGEGFNATEGQKIVDNANSRIKVIDQTITDLTQKAEDVKATAEKENAGQQEIVIPENPIVIDGLTENIELEKEVPLSEKDNAEEESNSEEPQNQEMSEEEEAEGIELAGKIQDFGVKIGFARKDTAEKGFSRSKGKETDKQPAWAKKYQVFDQVNMSVVERYGRKQLDADKFSLAIVKGRQFRTIKENIATEQEAKDMIPLIEVSLNHRIYPSSKNTDQFSIYRKWSSGKLFEIKKGFASKDEAMLYMAQHPEEIINYKTASVERPHLDKIERTGIERRKGNVTPEQFMQTFGLRAGEFGNWVAGDERQEMLNFAYDAFADMAEALGVPYKAISLNGRLAIGFGSRGQGLSGASAHFEPERGVINLTKMSGAGALAHEWFHAFDSYFGFKGKKAFEPNESGVIKLSSNANENYLSSDSFSPREYKRTEGGKGVFEETVRPEVVKAWKAVWNAMRYKTEQSTYDKTKAEQRRKNAVESLMNGLNSAFGYAKVDRTYGLRKKAATPEQIKRWEALIERVNNFDFGPVTEKKTKKRFAFEQQYEVQSKINELYKEITGREMSTYNMSYNNFKGIELYNEEIKRAEEGQTFEKKVPTTFYRDSNEMDKTRASSYWSTNHEMSARAFESFLDDQIKEAGYKNDYLVHSVSNGIYQMLYDAKPYPEKEERAKINEAFKNLFKVIETKEEGDNVVMFQIIGEKGASNIEGLVDNLTTAKQMTEAGKDAKTIFLATGWEKFKDGWKYDMPDIELNTTFDQIVDNYRNDKKEYSLSDLTNDVELFKSYPKLKDTKIFIYEKGSFNNAGGFANHTDNVIAVAFSSPERENVQLGSRGKNRPITAYNSASLKSVLSHEIQHLVQFIEGFGIGGNPRTVYANIVEDRLRRLQEEKGMENVTERDKEEIESGIRKKYRTSRNAYDNLAGEVESRNVQDRITLTPEQRREQMLSETQDVAEKQKIYIQEAIDKAYSVENIDESVELGVNINVSPLASTDLSNRPNVVKALTKISDELGEPVHIIHSSEAPVKDEQAKLQINSNNDIRALFYNGNVYVFSDRIISVSNAVKSYLHETVVHKGLRNTFSGADPVSIIGKQYAKFNDLMVDVFGSMTRTQKITIASKYAPNLYNQNGKIMHTPTMEEKALIGEEFLAHVSENQEIYDAPTLSKWQQFINRLLQIIRKAFRLTSNQFTQSDLLDIVRESRERIKGKTEGKTEDEIRLRVSEEKQAPNTILIDGVERSTVNSKRQPIAETEEGIRNFWKWFGDSKVVDGEGSPLVVYHGTKEDFNEFIPSKRGIWLTPDEKRAEGYAIARNNGEKGITMPLYAKIENISEYETNDDYVPYDQLGYDGWGSKKTNGEFFTIVVKSPSQIKSATGNDGSFNPQSNDIRFQIKELNSITTLPKSQLSDLLKSVNETVEANMTEAHGIKATPLWERIKAKLIEIKESGQHFKHITESEFPVVYDKLRQFEAIPDRVKKEAYERMGEIIRPISKNKEHYEAFERYIVLQDLVNDIENTGLFANKELPWGYETIDEVKTDMRNVRTYVMRNPTVLKAIRDRQTMMKEVKQALVANKLLKDNGNDKYFHHQVLAYMEGQVFPGVSSKDVRNNKKGWQRSRQGSIQAYNTNYIESEFEVLAQSLEQVAIKTILGEIGSKINIMADLIKQAENEGGKWRDYIPEGYKQWFPKQGTNAYKAASMAEKAVQNILKDPNSPDVAEQIAEVEGSMWVIPEPIAKQLDEMKDREKEMVFPAALRVLTGKWKQWILLNPYSATKYNFNNTSGDLDVILAYNPKILQRKYAHTAMIEARDEFRGKGMSQDMKEALQYGIITSGLSIQEIPDINQEALFRSITKGSGNWAKRVWANTGGRYWDGVTAFSQFRENILRVAAYKFFKEQIESGKTPFGASDHKAIQALYDENTNHKEIAAKLARELLGDYGNLSQAGQWLRAHSYPFWSWVEINTPRYYRMLKNTKFEDNSGTIGRIAGVGAKKTAVNIGKLGVKAALLMGLVVLWNRAMFPDEDDELAKQKDQKLKLIVGRREDGSIMTMKVQGAFSDILSYFGLEDGVNDIEQISEGKKSAGKMVAEAGSAFLNKTTGGAMPLTKTTFEMITKKSFYPDILNPRPVRDRAEQGLRIFKMDKIYNYLTHKPARAFGKEVSGLLVFDNSPGEAAYYTMRQNIFDYMKDNGEEFPSGEPTERSNALYYYKQSLKFGDTEKASFWYEKYKELGGTIKGYNASMLKGKIENTIPNDMKISWYKSLDAEDKEVLEMANKWYFETYLKVGIPKKGIE